MILKGLGTDIIEISRIQKCIQRFGSVFLDRLFTNREQQYCHRFRDPAPHFAARFAAKESAVKALGSGIGKKVSWHDFEVLNDDQGKPFFVLSSKLHELFDHPHLLLSMSHCEIYATAVVIWN
jgi:holo-[acyl-carrier protein] synthase